MEPIGSLDLRRNFKFLKKTCGFGGESYGVCLADTPRVAQPAVNATIFKTRLDLEVLPLPRRTAFVLMTQLVVTMCRL